MRKYILFNLVANCQEINTLRIYINSYDAYDANNKEYCKKDLAKNTEYEKGYKSKVRYLGYFIGNRL